MAIAAAPLPQAQSPWVNASASTRAGQLLQPTTTRTHSACHCDRAPGCSFVTGVCAKVVGAQQTLGVRASRLQPASGFQPPSFQAACRRSRAGSSPKHGARRAGHCSCSACPQALPACRADQTAAAAAAAQGAASGQWAEARCCARLSRRRGAPRDVCTPSAAASLRGPAAPQVDFTCQWRCHTVLTMRFWTQSEPAASQITAPRSLPRPWAVIGAGPLQGGS